MCIIMMMFSPHLIVTLKAQSDNTEDKLPIIRLTGNFGYDYQQGTVTLEYPDGSKEENLTATIKWRGGTTNTTDKHKRNYKIKFTEDHSFFGMRSDNKWILDAGQADIFRLRNRIATELWQDFAHKPYYADQEPKALNYVKGQVVEVYLNDEYRGIYCLTECMDRKQMKLKKFDKDGTIHGVLWKSTGYGSSMMNVVPDNYDNSQPMMDVFEAKYPEPGDDLPQTDYATLWNAINFVVNSSDEEFISHVADYFDIPVCLDYYLFINVLNALDNTGKNMYWAVYDEQTDKKITPAVWDLDMTIGASSLGHIYEGFTTTDYLDLDGMNLITRLKALDVDNFNQKVTQRYTELRNTYFSTQNLINRYTSYYNLLKVSGASEREMQKWSEDSDILGDVIDFDSEILYISNWITTHMQQLDKHFLNNQTGSDIVNTVNFRPENTNQPLYYIDGRRVVHSKSLNKGIYVKQGKKYIQ